MTNLRRLKMLADDETARKIWAMIQGELDPCEVSEKCDRWVRFCYHLPSEEAQILCAADDLLDTYGVEGWTIGGSLNDGVAYCNTGDTYELTLALVRGEFQVTSYESLATRYGS